MGGLNMQAFPWWTPHHKSTCRYKAHSLLFQTISEKEKEKKKEKETEKEKDKEKEKETEKENPLLQRCESLCSPSDVNR